MNRFPNHIVINVKISMNEAITHSYHLLPRKFGITTLNDLSMGDYVVTEMGAQIVWSF